MKVKIKANKKGFILSFASASMDLNNHLSTLIHFVSK